MAAPSHPSRNLALVAVVVVTAIIVAVVLGLGSDDSADKTVTTRPLATSSTTAPSTMAVPTTGPTTTIALPDGDYTAMCVQLQGLVDSYGAASNLDEFQTLFAGLDFEALIAASPEGTRAYVETLRDQRQQVLDVLAGADSLDDLQASSLPLTFYDSLQHLFAVAVQKCGFSGG